MRKVSIEVPTFLYPKKDPEHYCECQERPVELTHKTCLVFWQKQPGQAVQKDEVLAEIEAEKKTVELPSPASGTLAEVCVPDGEAFTFGTVLGYLNADLEEAANG